MSMWNARSRRLVRPGAMMLAALFAGECQVPMSAQQAPAPEKKEEPKDPFAEGGKDDEKKLVDKEGREYRICPQCGYNMYKQGRMWVCDNCGYSYVE